jgi:hypothetical protein
MKQPTVPFESRLLDVGEPNSNTDPQSRSRRDFTTLLPATFRTKTDHIVPPQLDIEFLERELLTRRLNDVQDFLWIAGRPMPPRPLHHQIVITREITITENVELHLVWSKNRIFIKPMPRYLLDPDFWAAHLSSSCKESDERKPRVIACALGFIFSYTALIAYESDFRLALEKGLIPTNVTWESWKAFSAEVLRNHCYASVNPRYWYGELRLSRLNHIYRYRLGFLLRGYSKVSAHTVYVDLIRDNFGVLAGILGYVVIVLTAMQVGLGVDRLVSDSVFQNVSYGFTIFSIIAPLVGGVLIMLGVLVMFLSNWMVTKTYERKRFQEMGVERFWASSKRDDPRRAKTGQSSVSELGSDTR